MPRQIVPRLSCSPRRTMRRRSAPGLPRKRTPRMNRILRTLSRRSRGKTALKQFSRLRRFLPKAAVRPAAPLPPLQARRPNHPSRPGRRPSRKHLRVDWTICETRNISRGKARVGRLLQHNRRRGSECCLSCDSSMSSLPRPKSPLRPPHIASSRPRRFLPNRPLRNRRAQQVFAVKKRANAVPVRRALRRDSCPGVRRRPA